MPRASRHTPPARSVASPTQPDPLAIMHGSSFAGDGRQALLDLAAGYDTAFAEAQHAA